MAAATVMSIQRIRNQPLPDDGDVNSQPSVIVKTGSEVIVPFLEGAALTEAQLYEAVYRFMRGGHIQPPLDFYEDLVMNAVLNGIPFTLLTRYNSEMQDKVNQALSILGVPSSAPRPTIGLRTQVGQEYTGPGAPQK